MTAHVYRQRHVAFSLLLTARPTSRSIAYCQIPFITTSTLRGLKTVSSRNSTSSISNARLRRFPSDVLSEEPKHPTIPLDSKYAVTGVVPNLNSTRPATLTLPQRQDPQYQSKFQYFFALGKAYGKFYLTGIKNVWGNSKVARSISRRCGGTSLSSLAKYPQNHEQHISCNEYELSIRNVYDLKKLIPFGIIFAICGEFTPLVVLFFGSAVVPNTCRIPRQREQDLKKQLEREDRYMQEAAALLQHYGSQEIPKQESDTLLAYLHNLTWFPKPLPIIGSLHYSLMIRRRLAHHYNELLCSAILTQREGGFSKRSPQDIWEWGNKYGLYSLRTYAREAVKQGKDPRSEDMKRDLLTVFEREVRYILDVDWRRIKIGAQWLAARNSVLDASESPDTKKRREELRKVVKEQEAASERKTTEQKQDRSIAEKNATR